MIENPRHRILPDAVDILFPAFNRLAFTQVAWLHLMANTDWSLVNSLRVFDDGSSDGTREFLDEAIRAAPVPASLTYLGHKSPVAVMRHYAANPGALLFAKIDNDIAVPRGWLNILRSVMDRHDDLEILGTQWGFASDPVPECPDELYTYQAANHIGGVGLFRSAAFANRQRLAPAGRFGFTLWQERSGAVIGWVDPGIYTIQLDLIPEEPFSSLSARYIANGWQREWAPYSPASAAAWSWVARP